MLSEATIAKFQGKGIDFYDAKSAEDQKEIREMIFADIKSAIAGGNFTNFPLEYFKLLEQEQKQELFIKTCLTIARKSEEKQEVNVIESVINTMVANGADVNQGDRFYQSPLLSLADLPKNQVNMDLVDYLLENGANVNATGDNKPPLFYAAEQCNIELMTKLVAGGADLNARFQGNNILHWGAVRMLGEEDQELLNLFLTSGTDISALMQQQNNEGESPLHQMIFSLTKQNENAIDKWLEYADFSLETEGYLTVTDYLDINENITDEKKQELSQKFESKQIAQTDLGKRSREDKATSFSSKKACFAPVESAVARLEKSRLSTSSDKSPNK